jgi:hypothetical protein
MRAYVIMKVARKIEILTKKVSINRKGKRVVHSFKYKLFVSKNLDNEVVPINFKWISSCVLKEIFYIQPHEMTVVRKRHSVAENLKMPTISIRRYPIYKHNAGIVRVCRRSCGVIRSQVGLGGRTKIDAAGTLNGGALVVGRHQAVCIWNSSNY